MDRIPRRPADARALNVGSLDLGSSGDIPPIFAQAAGADLLYVGVEPPKPQAETVVVPKDSPIHSVAELKGKRVAFQKGSSSHNLLLRLLQQAGLNLRDIQPLYLTPADARAASRAAKLMRGRSGTRGIRRCCWAATRGSWRMVPRWD